MKEQNPSEVDSEGIPGNYKVEQKADRTNRYGVYGDNRGEEGIWEERYGSGKKD